MILRELLASTPVFEIIGRRRIDIKDIAIRPEDVKAGYLYIYLENKTKLSYKEAVDMAMENGAIAIVIGSEDEIPENTITFIRTYHFRRFLSAVSRNFYRNPSQNLNLVGITGSHGKTTIGWMIKSILNSAGEPGVVIGSDFCQIGQNEQKFYSKGMSPIKINESLQKAVKERIRWGIIECAYTGIMEDQFSHIWFSSIIYTDLYTYFKNHKTDYHYFEMRKALIDHLKSIHNPIIVNVDDYYAHLLNREGSIGYGLMNEADITARDIKLNPKYSQFDLVTPEGNRSIKLNIPGIHNIYNVLASVGWSLAEGLDLDVIVKGIESLKDVDDSEEVVELDGNVYVKDLCYKGLEYVLREFDSSTSEDKDKKVVVFCMDKDGDGEEHEKISQAIVELVNHCILLDDYEAEDKSHKKIKDNQNNMKSINVYRHTDYYKAIQKAVNLLPDGGEVFLVKV